MVNRCAKYSRESEGYYCLCVHVLEQGVPVGSVYPPDEDNDWCGSIICTLKTAREHTTEELTLLCNVCCEEKGITKVGAQLPPKAKKPW